MCPTDLVTKNQSSFDRHTFMLCDLSNIFKYFLDEKPTKSPTLRFVPISSLENPFNFYAI